MTEGPVYGFCSPQQNQYRHVKLNERQKKGKRGKKKKKKGPINYQRLKVLHSFNRQFEKVGCNRERKEGNFFAMPYPPSSACALR